MRKLDFKILNHFLFIAVINLLISCQGREESHSKLQFNIPPINRLQNLLTTTRHSVVDEDATAPFAPDSISGFDCIMVNVVGNGIGNWDLNSGKVGIGRNFSYFGSYSKMISTSTGGEVTLKIKKGTERFIQIVGVISTVGCPSEVSESDLASFEKFPGLFIIGSKKQDIFQDVSIKISSSYVVENTADFRGSVDDPYPNSDTTAPTPGNSGNLNATSTSSTSATISWTEANDDSTLSSQLKYKLVMATSSDSINTITEVNDLTGGSVILNWVAGETDASVTSLNPATTYYFSLLVKDSFGNKTLFSLETLAPACTCNEGEYISGDSCVSAGLGYWASSCTQTACTNKPDNSSYTSTGESSSSCAWSCNEGYSPNASYTACESNSGYASVGCTQHQLVTGFSGRSGSWMDKLGVRCRNFSSGSLTGSTSTGTEYGGEGGGPFSQDCPSGSAVYLIEYANTNDGSYAGRFRFKCKNTSSGLESGWYGFYGESGDSFMSIQCEDDKYLNWWTISSAGGYTGPFGTSYGCL